jgi:tetratricopeptide (TPR) repeat protein
VKNIAPILLAGALILTGCTKAGSSATPPAKAAGDSATQKPPLQVPAQFANEADKRGFAVKAVGDGYYAEALPLLEQTVAAEPNAIAYRELGTARYNLKDYKGAADAWTQAGKLDSTLQAQMESNVGNTLRDSKDYAGAEAAYRKALQIDPHRWQAAINLATMLRLNGKTEDAVAVLQAAIPDNKDITPLSNLLKSLQEASASQTNGSNG